MSLLQNIKKNYKDELKTVTIGGKVINFITEWNQHYGEFISQWEIDGVDTVPVKARYADKYLLCACSNSSVGEREFNRSIKLEFLYQAIGWEDKIKLIEKEVTDARMAEIHKTRPSAKAEDYDFTFTIGQKLDYKLMEIARDQRK